MTLTQRTSAFVQLGRFLKDFREKTPLEKEQRFHDDLEKLIAISFSYNGWFTRENVLRALHGIETMLNEKELAGFAASVSEPKKVKTVAVIMAGNIPAVGFHDLLCVLLSGHRILIKVSSEDHALIPFLAGMLIYFEQGFAEQILFSENRLQGFDAVIATGSNNSAKHFEYYFGKYPNIIRKSRVSTAVLTGKESLEQLKALGHDIFDYFGLGCRNVSKIFVPAEYSFNVLYEAIYDFKDVLDNKKYANNYEYNRAIYLLDSVQFLDNNFLMIKEDKGFASPVSVLYFERYSSMDEVEKTLAEHAENIQCIVGDSSVLPSVPFGESQSPRIHDFADKVNTIDFLNKL